MELSLMDGNWGRSVSSIFEELGGGSTAYKFEVRGGRFVASVDGMHDSLLKSK